MSHPFKKILKSHYCKIVFAFFFVLSFYLVPHKLFQGLYLLLVVLFSLSFSAVMTCLVLNMKERYKNAKDAGKSVLGIVAALLGLSALQVCTVGGGFCAISLGSSIVAAIFPGVAFHFMSRYAVAIIIVSILIQVYSLYKMRCFKK